MHLPVILRINKVTNQLISLCPILLLMTGIDRYLTKTLTDVMVACLGIAGDAAPVCSFSLSGFSITQIGAAASSRGSYHEAGRLIQDQQAMRLVPLPPGGGTQGLSHVYLVQYPLMAIVALLANC